MIFCMHAYHFCSVWWDIYLELYCYAWLCCIWQFQHTKNAPKSGWYSLLLVLGKSQTASLVNSSPPRIQRWFPIVSLERVDEQSYFVDGCFWGCTTIKMAGEGAPLSCLLKLGYWGERGDYLIYVIFSNRGSNPFSNYCFVVVYHREIHGSNFSAHFF